MPTCNLRLFRPHSITEKYPDETINIIADGIMLSGTVDNPDRSPVFGAIIKYKSFIIHNMHRQQTTDQSWYVSKFNNIYSS